MKCAQTLKPYEGVKRDLQYIKKKFEELASIYDIKDPNLLWVLYALIETNDLTLTRKDVEKVYQELTMLGLITEEEGKKAIYHLFDAPFREFKCYGGFIFNIAKEDKRGEEVVFLNEKVLIEIAFKMFLGKPSLTLGKILRSLVQ